MGFVPKHEKDMSVPLTASCAVEMALGRGLCKKEEVRTKTARNSLISEFWAVVLVVKFNKENFEIIAERCGYWNCEIAWQAFFQDDAELAIAFCFLDSFLNHLLEL